MALAIMRPPLLEKHAVGRHVDIPSGNTMQNSKSTTTNSLLRVFKKPAVGIAGSIASIIALGFAVHLYIDSRTTRDLVYFVHPERAAVVRAEQTSRLQIELDGEVVRRDVTAVQVAFWNEGEDAIRSQNLLSPFIISTGPRHPILEAGVRKLSRGVIGISLDKSGIHEGRLRIDWTILEQKDGATLQIVYLGDVNVPVKASATVEGQGEVRALEYDGRIQTAQEQYAQGGRGVRSLGYMYFGFTLAILGFGVLSLHKRLIDEGQESVDVSSVIWHVGLPLLLFGMALFLLNYGAVSRPRPPFGF